MPSAHLSPDLLGTQECVLPAALFLRAGLPDYSFVGVGRNELFGAYSNGNFAKGVNAVPTDAPVDNVILPPPGNEIREET